MDKFLRGFIIIEKFHQSATLVCLILFLGYLGFSNVHSTNQPKVQVTSSTTLP
jgi:hypothetical protein